jgi:hypothetical protein
MTDKDEQLQHFSEAVERKAKAAREASHEQPQPHATDEENPTGERQGNFSAREKSTAKGKMTADKWNQ